MGRIFLGVGAALSVSVGADAGAQSLPNLFNDGPSLTLGQATLGRNCFSLPAGALDLDCNSAFLADEDKRVFRAELIGSDQIWTLNRYRQQLANNDSVGVAAELLQHSQPMVASGAASLWYQHDWWALGYVPFRGGFAYAGRNPAYPEVSAQVYRESEFFAKAGLFSSDDHNFRVGLQSRFVQRDYIYQLFDVFDAFSDPSVAAIQHQNAFYLEPSFVYTWPVEFAPTLAGSYSNLPIFQSGDTLTPQPIFDFGLGLTFGDSERPLHASLHYTSRPDAPYLINQISLGATYDFAHELAIQMLLGKDQFGAGLSTQFGVAIFGISYKYARLAPDSWLVTDSSTFNFELGLGF